MYGSNCNLLVRVCALRGVRMRARAGVCTCVCAPCCVDGGWTQTMSRIKHCQAMTLTSCHLRTWSLPPHCNCQRAELQDTPHRSHHGEVFLFPPFGVPMSGRPSQGSEGRASWSSHSPHTVFPARSTTKCIIVWHCPSPHKRHWQRSVNIGASGSSFVTTRTLLVESAQRHSQGRDFFSFASSARARRFSASFDIAPAIVRMSTNGRADPRR